MCIHTNEPDEMAIAFLEANERMGWALEYIYRKYPAIRDEVLAYLDNGGPYGPLEDEGEVS